jgi:hypothetical protein
MPRDSLPRMRAESEFALIQKRAPPAEAVLTPYEVDLQAVRNRTARLRAFRQATERQDGIVPVRTAKQ